MKFTEIEHPSHPQHTLTLVAAQEPYSCDGCKQRGFRLGERSCYECKQCNFHLHEECAMPESSAFHPFFKTCEFKFVENVQGERRCDACGKDVLGFVYQCQHKKAYDLHPCCMKLERTLNGDGVKLYLREKVSSGLKCLKCKSKNIARDLKGWSYESNCGHYCYHVACVKDLILDNWKKGQTSDTGLQIMVPNMEDAVEQSGRSKNGKKVNKYLTKAILVLRLIISAIFGDPIGIAVVCFEQLFSS
ncbi:hypothetical protein RGQ29_028989 [Quercus rubra]|uniref:Phorbol-ester/DAG-type domain-containing protein n=1 Tax=Quercus rubra TaxID=3512 RepID=A0AAN7ETE9_QUERU|nr:hypothetical protein RGQ29_028989 [Quercus rubra]